MAKQTLTKTELDSMAAAMDQMLDGEYGPEIEIEIEDEGFNLTAPDGYENDESDSLGEQTTNDSMEAYAGEDAIADDFYFEDDGQPTEYEEWQDFDGGDDWDHGQYDEC